MQCHVHNWFLLHLQLKLYHAVIDDVIAGVRDSFLDEGVDEQVLQEMKQVWTNKLMASKAVELTIEPLEQQQPSIISNNTPKSKVCTHLSIIVIKLIE